MKHSVRIPDLERIEHYDRPVPSFNLTALLASAPGPLKNSNETISIEVSVVSGQNLTLVKQDPHIFYDSEVLAIVHRGKSRTSGLVTTTVWGWKGLHVRSDNKEESKLQEIATRFNTTLVGSFPNDQIS